MVIQELRLARLLISHGCREPGGVRHKALVIPYGVHQGGRREVIGLDVGEAETEAFLRGLRTRGLVNTSTDRRETSSFG